MGRHLREFLPDATYVSSADCDLRDQKSTADLMASGWDRVIHLAARVGGILDNMNHQGEFIEDNLLMNAHVLKYARLSGVRRLTALLSTCIYPDVAESYPLKEADLHAGPPQATNFAYATAKRAMAVHIDAYRMQWGLSYNYLIPCNLYGPHDRFDSARSHFLTALVGKIVEAEMRGERSIRLLGTGAPLRQFLYAGDLARVIAMCVDRDIVESFNVAVDENISIRTAAETTIDALGKTGLGIEFDMTSPDGQFRKDVSNTKLRALFPDFHFTPLADGVRIVYDRYKEVLR